MAWTAWPQISYCGLTTTAVPRGRMRTLYAPIFCDPGSALYRRRTATTVRLERFSSLTAGSSVVGESSRAGTLETGTLASTITTGACGGLRYWAGIEGPAGSLEALLEAPDYRSRTLVSDGSLAERRSHSELVAAGLVAENWLRACAEAAS